MNYQENSTNSEGEIGLAAKLNPFQRLIGVVFSPGETFKDIAIKPNWVVPILLAIAILIAGNQLITRRLKIDPEKIARQAITKQFEKQGKSISDLSPEQKEALEGQIKISVKIQSYIPLITVLTTPISIAFLTFVFWLGSLLMGLEVNYKRLFSVTAYSFSVVVVFLATVVNTVVAFIRDPEDIDILRGIAVTNPGMLLPETSPSALIALLSRFDIFSIWFLILMIIAIPAISKKADTTKSTVLVMGLWTIWILISVGWAALFG
ncbi:MAG: YIP1 family protein [Blastocatellia bacterium]|nr:YIP1 family protein [Blastocatellia bacterium]